MKLTNGLIVTSLILVIGCQWPTTDPEEFEKLCGPQPTQLQADEAVREWVRSEFKEFNSRTIMDVKIVGSADRRFGALNLGARQYGWKITFYAKSPAEINKFSDIYDMLWNNGKFSIGNDGY